MTVAVGVGVGGMVAVTVAVGVKVAVAVAVAVDVGVGVTVGVGVGVGALTGKHPFNEACGGESAAGMLSAHDPTVTVIVPLPVAALTVA